ncbi:MAG: nucleotidyltransferase family protein [Anaerolineales bacterium]|nr:nucleotidyltransferase family protein [Anaerolineales bacterium]
MDNLTFEERPGYHNLCKVLAGGPLHWEAPGQERGWLATAERQGVAPLLYWHFHHGTWPGSLSAQGREGLTRLYYNSLAQNSLLMAELNHLLDLFAQADIPVMVLKGGALADGYYDDIGLRPMGDLDLLIPEAKMEPACTLIRALGYQPAHEEIAPGILRQVAHHISWRGGPGGRLGVELHWHLIAGPADDRTVSVDWFWKQIDAVPGRTAVLHGKPIPQLHPTAHLLYLAAHLSLRHGGNRERLVWFYDADRLIRSGRVDWPAFERQAHALRWGAVARFLLEGAGVYFATPLPPGVLERLAQGLVWQRFLGERQAKIGHLTRTVLTWQGLRHLPWPLRLRWLVALVFPSRDYLFWRYHPQPAWTWPLYYGYRWWDIAHDWAEIVFSVTPTRLSPTRLGPTGGRHGVEQKNG